MVVAALEGGVVIEGGVRPLSSIREQISPAPVITNKFSTRNEVRKRERVNPKVRGKGVAVRALILGRRRTRGGNEKKEEQEEGVESGERERKITLG